MKFDLLHACIRVFDLEKSLKFYKEALGLIEVSRSDFPEDKFTLVYLSDESKSYEIELTYNYNPEKPYEAGNGFGHFAFDIVDLEEAHKFHKEMGLNPTELMGLVDGEKKFYFIQDPDGYNIEILRK